MSLLLRCDECKNEEKISKNIKMPLLLKFRERFICGQCEEKKEELKKEKQQQIEKAWEEIEKEKRHFVELSLRAEKAKFCQKEIRKNV